MRKALSLLLFCILFTSCNTDNSPTFYSLLIEVTPEGSGTVDFAADTLIEKGKTVNLRAIPETGFVFAGWNGTIQSTENPLEITISEDIELIAGFEKKSYELKTEIMGEGTITETVLPAKTEYEHGTVVQLSAIPAEKSRFVRWSGDVVSEDSVIEVTVESPLEINAEFEREFYKVEVNVEGNGSLADWDTTNIKWFRSNSTITLQPVPDTTWVFRRWEGDFSTQEEVLEFDINSDISLDLIFEEGELDYCLPKSLDAYRHKAGGDSVKILDWDFNYEGKFITSFDKRIDVTQTGQGLSTHQRGDLIYSDDKLIRFVLLYVRFNNRNIYEFAWDGDQVSKYNYLIRSNIEQDDISTAMIYEEPCGLALHEGNTTWSSGDYGIFAYQYYYTNSCKTFNINQSDFSVTYEDESSIYKDVNGIPGFLGAIYEHLIADNGSVLLPNADKLRLKSRKTYPIGRHELGWGTEVYQYYDHIINEEYPRYFSSRTTYAKSDLVENDSHVVEYYCGYK
ncbi:InlB B-repeat-containing protein [Gracilimonas mengyeensis]|uniref:Bacterial repeat domain-containing protein n=1 Tax=Gracilimonas mengyeensis TaxID=1302730 RepID=A0A521EPR6_9BACT|nr:hypothetical protein [Gracilimonas mengyeensis]SMO85907.1 hypothetical protein SAMN06265219_11326 [Gracilimonas mengyeensis]